MSYSSNNIVSTTTVIKPAGLSNANYGFATLFITKAAGATATVPILPNNYVDYESTSDVINAGFALESEVYLAASAWLGAVPSTGQLRVYVIDEASEGVPVAMPIAYAAADDQFWWGITLNADDVFSSENNGTDVIAAATWCNDNGRFMPHTSLDATTESDSVCKQIDDLGFRFVYSTFHPTDKYAAVPAMTWFATSNPDLPDSSLTLEYKVISNVTSVNLTKTEENTLREINCGFVSDIEAKGSKVVKRYINSKTHSANGEFVDSVWDSVVLANRVQTAVTNIIINQLKKLKQTTGGQSVILSVIRSEMRKAIRSGYLGPRKYVSNQTGEELFTDGFEIRTKATDIYDLSDGDLAKRESAPVLVDIYPADAIHSATIEIDVN